MDENKDGINTSDPSVDSTPDPQGSTGNDDGKTFTQEDVDNIVESRLAKERKKIPPKEELDAFRAWQAEQKKNQPEDQQMAELQRQHDEALAKLQAYQDREAVMLKGVLPEFAEFAAFQVRRQVTDDSDFDTELDKWLKTNTRFLTSEEDSVPATASGMRHQKSPQKNTSGVYEAFYEKNPELKPKE